MSGTLSIEFPKKQKGKLHKEQSSRATESIEPEIKQPTEAAAEVKPKGARQKSRSVQRGVLTEKEFAGIKEAFYPNPDDGPSLAKAMDTDAYYENNELAADVLKNKYLAPDEKGPLHLWHRVAKAISSVEENPEGWYLKFFSILKDFQFIPGGRILHAAGREDARRRPTLSNCYVIPIREDSLEGIYRCISDSAMVYRTGGGVGTDLSTLRPRGAPVNATVDRSPGVTAFMNLFSESTNTVSQAGRRGALMLTLRVDHPDIEDFVTIKSDSSRSLVQHANISVLLTHKFMEAVLEDTDFDLEWGGEVYRTVRAKALWDKIINSAHASAEPGIIFWDTMKEYHNNEYAKPLSSTNPCGEQPLPDFTACNLGNINLASLVDDNGDFDFARLEEITAIATRFLDDVIDYNSPNHALDEIRDAVNADRRVGLGITALGDALIKMKIRYDTPEALDAVDKVLKSIRDVAYETSIALAQKKETYSLFEWKGYSKSKFVKNLPRKIHDMIRENGIRNCTVLTLPPAGTGSIIAETSSGIEPVFHTSYERRVKNADGRTFKTYKVYHPLIKKQFGNDGDLPDYVITAHDIDPYFRVKMQGAIQKYIDSSISSTVNLPEDTSPETIADIYISAYKAGLKGITVYREGSREGILKAKQASEAEAEPTAGSELPATANPRHRPGITFGVTERLRTGEGNLYITINEDENGLCEVFTTIGKAGGNAQAQSEAISRLISLALRSGIDPMALVKQLKGISGPSPVWQNGEVILSTPDAIGKAIERYIRNYKLKPNGKGKANFTFIEGEETTEEDTLALLPIASPICPECSSSLVHESGCVVCKNCGYSKCT